MKKDKNCNCDKQDCGTGSCPVQQRIFEREVDEELRQEQLAQWWKKYRFLVIGGAVAVILATIGMEFYQSWWNKVRLSESDKYETAMIQAVQNNNEQAIADFKDLSQTGKTGYRYLAEIEQAGILLKTGDKQQALTILKGLVDNDDVPNALRQACLISYVGHQVDDGNTSELLALLSPILADKESAFFGNASELSALLYRLSGDNNSAKAVLEMALSQENIQPSLRERLVMLQNEVK
jgi:hypothetical protein